MSNHAMTPSASATMDVAGVLIMGDRPEPFLSACLASLAPAVDRLFVNDNAASDRTNRDTLVASDLYRDGRVEVVTAPFDGFGPCRMRCLDALARQTAAEQWVLYVDCDEVHHDGLRILTREMLPNVRAGVGVVDGWFYQFYQSPRYFLSIDRRHNLLFRFHPGVRWEGAVHEKVLNLRGGRVAVPYRYFHYGYVATVAHVRRRWEQYGALGDAVSGGQVARIEQFLAGEARRAVRYGGSHPIAARGLLADHERAQHDAVQRFDALAAAAAASRNGVARTRDRLSLVLARRLYLGGVVGRRAAALRHAMDRLVASERAMQAAR